MELQEDVAAKKINKKARMNMQHRRRWITTANSLQGWKPLKLGATKYSSGFLFSFANCFDL
jgi:hypothetical protein